MKAVALLLLASLASAGTAHGDDGLSPRELWLQTTAASDSRNVKERDRSFKDLLDRGRELGVLRFPLYAESAASLALQAHAEKNIELARWAIDAAQTLDPDSPSVNFAAADLARSQGRMGEVIGHLVRGVGNILVDGRTRVLSRANLTIAASLAISACAFIFVLALFLLYFQHAAHDLRESFSILRGGVGWVVAFALLILPLFLWLDPIWLCLFWMTIFFGYARIGERAMIVLMLALLAIVPVALDWATYQIVFVDSPVLQAARAHLEQSYDPDAARRLRDLIDIEPNDGGMRLLLANMDTQIGEEQEAMLQYSKAIELETGLAGAHLNLGNLHFLRNDLQTAMIEYDRAAQYDASMAIAYYNSSVANGQLYKFNEQGTQLEIARQRSRALVQKILSDPPPQKIVVYRMPIERAWNIAERVANQEAVRDVYGSYALFDLASSVRNPLTAGALGALAFGVLLWGARRKTGFAGECVKCGRNFCRKCKSTHESAGYCTQCIHIYLKRDGVSLDTKRTKLAEVQSHQVARHRRKRIFALVLPGAAQILDGAPVRGLLALLVFFFFISIAALVGNLAPLATPATTIKLVLRLTALLLAVVTWILVSLPIFRQRPVQAGV